MWTGKLVLLIDSSRNCNLCAGSLRPGSADSRSAWDNDAYDHGPDINTVSTGVYGKFVLPCSQKIQHFILVKKNYDATPSDTCLADDYAHVLIDGTKTKAPTFLEQLCEGLFFGGYYKNRFN